MCLAIRADDGGYAEPRTERQYQGVFAQRPKKGSCKSRRQPLQQVTGMFSTPPPVHELVEMGKVGIFFPGIWDWFVWVAVHSVPLEHAAFGASIAIPLPETLEEVHSGMLRRGVLAHSDLGVA